jgi:hypothetical protein
VCMRACVRCECVLIAVMHRDVATTKRTYRACDKCRVQPAHSKCLVDQEAGLPIVVVLCAQCAYTQTRARDPSRVDAKLCERCARQKATSRCSIDVDHGAVELKMCATCVQTELGMHRLIGDSVTTTPPPQPQPQQLAQRASLTGVSGSSGGAPVAAAAASPLADPRAQSMRAPRDMSSDGNAELAYYRAQPKCERPPGDFTHDDAKVVPVLSMCARR